MDILKQYYLYVEEGDVEQLYKDYQKPDHWSEGQTQMVLSMREDYFKKQRENYFTAMGVKNEQAFIEEEKSLIAHILSPLVLLRHPDYLPDAEKRRILSACETAGGALECYMESMEERLKDNIAYEHPDTVYKLIRHIEALILALKEACRPLGFWFEEHPFYNILKDWLIGTKREYPDGRLALRLQTFKSNPINTAPATTFNFASFFVSETVYEQVRQLWLQKALIDSSGRWKYKRRGNKGLLIALLKHLQTHPKGFGKSRVDKQELSLIIRYSFGVTLSNSLIAHKSSVEALDEYLPICLL